MSLKETNITEWKKRRAASSKKWRESNLEKHKQASKIRSANYYKRPEIKAKVRNKLLLRLYNITLDDQNKMLLEQSNKCKVCPNTLDDKQLNIDHCHTTGKVRGILCSRCNLAIGLLRDNPEIVESLLNYLKQ